MTVNIPDADHEEVLLGSDREMIEMWNAFAIALDRQVIQVFGQLAGKTVSEIVPTVAYAHVAKAAYGLCSAADIASEAFDPVEFGTRCARIAQEQIERYLDNIAKMVAHET